MPDWSVGIGRRLLAGRASPCGAAALGVGARGRGGGRGGEHGPRRRDGSGWAGERDERKVPAKAIDRKSVV